MNAGGLVILKYSAPLAKGTAPLVTINGEGAVGMATVAPDEDENTVTITMPINGTSVTLTNVRLDLREAEVPVTDNGFGYVTVPLSPESLTSSPKSETPWWLHLLRLKS